MGQFKICFRDGKDLDYQEMLSSLKQGFNQRAILPFLGAGSSHDAPSDLPMSHELCEPLIRVLWESVQPVIEQANPPRSDVEFAHSILAKARLERLLDALQQVYGQIALRYLQLLNSDRWNENHASLAALSNEGMLNQCVTLNFDLLIEYAAKAHGVDFQTICPFVHERDNQEITHGIVVIKPHGTFEMSTSSDNQLTKLRTTMSQLGTEPHPLSVAVLSSA